jgi:hypothetical protein
VEQQRGPRWVGREVVHAPDRDGVVAAVVLVPQRAVQPGAHAVEHRGAVRARTPGDARELVGAAWSSASTLTPKRPMALIAGQVVEVRAGEKLTSGGSSDSDANDWQVKPTGPSALVAVITTTPDAKCPSTSRIRVDATGVGDCTWPSQAVDDRPQ